MTVKQGVRSQYTKSYQCAHSTIKYSLDVRVFIRALLKRFTEEQIIGMLKEWGAELTIEGVARKYGVSKKSLYLWRRKFGGLGVSDAKRLKTLELELTAD